MGPSQDLQWWDTPSWIPRWKLQLTRGLAAGLAAGLAVGLTDRFEHGSAVPVGIWVGISVGVVVGRLTRIRTSSRAHHSRSRAHQLSRSCLYLASAGRVRRARACCEPFPQAGHVFRGQAVGVNLSSRRRSSRWPASAKSSPVRPESRARARAVSCSVRDGAPGHVRSRLPRPWTPAAIREP